LRLGISIEWIRPGHPQQNGRHERMHLTLKNETTRPAAANLLQQQAKFDAFVQEFNCERPHEALNMQCPGQVYTASARPYQAFPIPITPFTTRLSWSPTAAAFAFIARKSISVPAWPAKLSVSKK
jgi:integrase-like protein